MAVKLMTTLQLLNHCAEAKMRKAAMTGNLLRRASPPLHGDERRMWGCRREGVQVGPQLGAGCSMEAKAILPKGQKYIKPLHAANAAAIPS